MQKKPKVKTIAPVKTDVLAVVVVLLKVVIAAFVLMTFILTIAYSALLA